jgi:hypothetical protein
MEVKNCEISQKDESNLSQNISFQLFNKPNLINKKISFAKNKENSDDFIESVDLTDEEEKEFNLKES